MGSYVKKILILGGESSGKSTLSAELANKVLHVPLVREYGRDYCDFIGRELTIDDMYVIASVQIREEETAVYAAIRTGSEYIVCDTSLITTYWYSLNLCNGVDYRLRKAAMAMIKQYDYIFLCDNDIPFVQDGTRQNEDFRQRGYNWYQKKLDRLRLPYHIVSGSVEDRVNQVVKVLTQS